MRAFGLLPAFVQPANRDSARIVAWQADEKHAGDGETLALNMERRPASSLRPRKPEPEHRVALPRAAVAHRHGQGPLAPDNHH